MRRQGGFIAEVAAGATRLVALAARTARWRLAERARVAWRVARAPIAACAATFGVARVAPIATAVTTAVTAAVTATAATAATAFTTAFTTAGAIGGSPGSPTPLGASPLGTMWVSTTGASGIRSTG